MAVINLRKIIKDEAAATEVADSVEQYISECVGQAIQPKLPFEVGKTYLIRTVTMVDVGRVTKLCGNFIVIEDASWIADTGRFHECLKSPEIFVEVEPFAYPIFLNTQSIVDATLWPFDLPTKAK